MGKYETGDILCYEFNNKFLCGNCAEKSGEEITEDNIVTDDDVEKSDIIFCDECKLKIW